jgi:hypothetical protein
MARMLRNHYQPSLSICAFIPVEQCYLGWQESLSQLAELVQPEIPDQG